MNTINNYTINNPGVSAVEYNENQRRIVDGMLTVGLLFFYICNIDISNYMILAICIAAFCHLVFFLK